MVSKSDLVLAHELRTVTKKLNARIRKKISDVGQLSDAEENVVRTLIRKNEVLPSELCTALGLSSQFASQVLNRLQDLNLITRKQSQTDKRKILVSLSAKGRSLVENMKQETNEWIAGAISARYSARQKEIIKQAVELLATLPDLL